MNTTEHLDCDQRINALGAGRFLINEARHWFFKSSHIQIICAIGVLLIVITLTTEGFESNSKFVAFLGVFMAWNIGLLNARDSASDCYVEGFRQGYIMGAVKHWEPELLDTEVKEKYLNKRLKEFETSISDAQVDSDNEEFFNSQKDYLMEGLANARLIFSRKFRNMI